MFLLIKAIKLLLWPFNLEKHTQCIRSNIDLSPLYQCAVGAGGRQKDIVGKPDRAVAVHGACHAVVGQCDGGGRARLRGSRAGAAPGVVDVNQYAGHIELRRAGGVAVDAGNADFPTRGSAVDRHEIQVAYRVVVGNNGAKMAHAMRLARPVAQARPGVEFGAFPDVGNTAALGVAIFIEAADGNPVVAEPDFGLHHTAEKRQYGREGVPSASGVGAQGVHDAEVFDAVVGGRGTCDPALLGGVVGDARIAESRNGGEEVIVETFGADQLARLVVDVDAGVVDACCIADRNDVAGPHSAADARFVNRSSPLIGSVKLLYRGRRLLRKSRNTQHTHDQEYGQ